MATLSRCVSIAHVILCEEDLLILVTVLFLESDPVATGGSFPAGISELR